MRCSFPLVLPRDIRWRLDPAGGASIHMRVIDALYDAAGLARHGAESTPAVA